MTGLISFLLSITAYGVSIDIEPKHPVDQYGRRLVFHGVNAAYKLPPYLPQTNSFDPQYSISAEDIQFMQLWGHTLARPRRHPRVFFSTKN